MRNGVITWTLSPAIPAGSSGEVTFTLNTTNYQTPNGAVIQPTATVSATGQTSATANRATSTVTSSVKMITSKRRTTDVLPTPGQQVTYQIWTGHENGSNNRFGFGSPAQNGELGLVNVVTKDVLPPGAVFVSASGGGTYDPATRTVTWPAWSDQNTGNPPNWFRPPIYDLTVTYPTSTPVTSTVTNTASATATTVGSNTVVSSNDSVSHGFQAATSAGSVSKGSRWQAARPAARGTNFFYDVNFRNTGNQTLDMHTEDYLPCTYTSPRDGSTTCSSPGLTNIYFTFDPPNKGTTTISYRTNRGTQGSLTLAPGADQYRPTVAPGEWITWFSTDTQLAGGVSNTVRINGSPTDHVAAETPADVTYVNPDVPKAGVAPLLENCLSNITLKNAVTGDVVRNQSGGTALCGYIKVIPDTPRFGMRKWVETSTTVVGGQQVNYMIDVNNGGTAPAYPIVADLLPKNVSFVRAEYRFPSNSGFRVMGDAPAFDTEVIENFNGTGRTLVRITWPDGSNLPTSGGTAVQEVDLRIVAKVDERAPKGTLKNEVRVFDAKRRNYGTDAHPAQCSLSTPQKDTDNWSGLDDPNNNNCATSANIEVLATSAITGIKSVKGSADTDWVGPNRIGNVDPNAPAQYKLDITNGANTPIKNVVAYDILPFVGDTGVGPASGQQRGSAWQAQLTGPVDLSGLPSAVRGQTTVQYSTSSNPCRGEVITAGAPMPSAPAGCTNDWTTSVSDWSQVKAIRISFGSSELGFDADGSSVTWSPIINVTAPT